MSLSRMVCVTGRQPVYVVIIQPYRAAGFFATLKNAKPKEPEKSDEPGFFKRIYCRFKGIPLKGEVHPPRAFFEDVDKEFFAPESLPEMPKDFKEYPERDIRNYPYPTRRMYPPKSRMLMFPDSWFTPFYQYTGVSGPYFFFGGLFLFLLNKEIFVVDDASMILLNWIILYVFFTRAFGYRLDKFSYGLFKKEMDRLKAIRAEELNGAKALRETIKAETASLTAVKENFPTALKEVMEMQLEAGYRMNVAKAVAEMKRRISYLQETEEAQKRFKRKFMFDWIVKAVKKDIEENKDGIKERYLSDCIKRLGVLAEKTN